MLELILAIGIVGAIIFLLSHSSGKKSRYKQRNYRNKSSALRRELLKRVDKKTANRLIRYEKLKNPGKPEHWYLDKIVYDLKRGR